MERPALPRRLEDYLETIAELCEQHGHAHVRDIARARGVRMATVSEAVDALTARGLVRHRNYGAAQLTEEGKRVAERVRRRHRILREFFYDLLGLPEEIAEHEACALEHTVSEVTLQRIEELIECVRRCDERGGGCQCLRRFRRLGQQAAGEPQQ